jgi:hypothetical protein
MLQLQCQNKDMLNLIVSRDVMVRKERMRCRKTRSCWKERRYLPDRLLLALTGYELWTIVNYDEVE